MKVEAEAMGRQHDFNHEEDAGEGLVFDPIEDCIKSFGTSLSLSIFLKVLSELSPTSRQTLGEESLQPHPLFTKVVPHGS